MKPITIQEANPQISVRRAAHISDFHEPTPAERYDQELREGYARRLHIMLKAAAQGGVVGRNFMLFEYKDKPYAEKAMFAMYAAGVNLYPQYPFYHLFITLACPWRKLAVLVEEEETEWTEQQITDEDELLTLNGWRVFRIPYQVARVYKEDVLPDHISYGLENGWQNPGEKEEYERLAPQLRLICLDGFFEWLRKEHFSRQALRHYQAAATARANNEFMNTPRPTPEEEAADLYQAALNTDGGTLVDEEMMRIAFLTWAKKALLDLDRDPNNNYYLSDRTQGAWVGWQAAHSYNDNAGLTFGLK
jgi:hypothetical protein